VAIQRTGWRDYRDTLALHQQYITQVDSFRSPARPPLWRVFDDFFVRPYRALPINIAVAFFVTISFVVSCVKRRAPLLMIMAAFGPFCLFAWLMLDRFSASRFSIGYAPMIAILAADGIALVTRRAALVVAAILVAMMIVWSWPAVRGVHTTPSPPQQAADWIRAHVDPHTPLFVHGSMGPYAEAMLDGFDRRYVMAPPPARGWYLREDASNAPGAVNFAREHGRLWELTRHRYFEVSIRPLTAAMQFGDGWYGEEGSGAERWRWMSGHSEAVLPAEEGTARLTMGVYVPEVPTNVVVTIDGVVVASARATEHELDIRADVPSKAGPRRMAIDVDRTIVPSSGDRRVLGLRLNEIFWNAAARPPL